MAPPAGANGVLPVAVLQKNTPQKNATSQAPRGPKAAQPRLKLVCRRLPPGLTKAEFDSALGEEWKVGAGKVDWLYFRRGKISTDAAKPSKPARAYLRVTKPDHIKPLGDHMRAITFHDAAKSWQDPALVGPPTLEFAPYPKMPGGRRRHDNRQGTIDQDQEFKDFLESLTNPITKPAAPEAETQKEKVKTTPLIEALREKKANRDKPNTRSNRQNRGEGKDDNTAEKKILSKSGKENAATPGDKNRRSGKADKAQATKEAAKILNKEAAATKANSAATKNEKAAASPAPERKRGNVALAKSMLQRDLGVGPAPNRRRGTKREVGTAAASSSATQTKDTPPVEEKTKEVPVPQSAPVSTPDKNKKERPTRAERRAFKAGNADKSANKASPEETKVQTPTKAPAPQILKKPQTPAAPKGPAAMRLPPTEPKNSPASVQAKADTATAPSNSVTPKALPPSPAPAPTSKQAFLKHANPSQGITEPLIEETMKAFGGVDKVEIDKRKGFAYVDFAEPEGLQKAMAASPIKIAQGAVQVLERKEKVARAPRFPGPNGPPTGPARGGRGGFAPRGGRGGRGGARGGHAAPNPAATGGEAVQAAATAAHPAPAAPAPATNAEAGT